MTVLDCEEGDSLGEEEEEESVVAMVVLEGEEEGEFDDCECGAISQ